MLQKIRALNDFRSIPIHERLYIHSKLIAEYKEAIVMLEQKFRQEKELAQCTFHPNPTRKHSPDSQGSNFSPGEFTLRKSTNFSHFRRRSQDEFYKESVEEFLDRKNQKVKKLEEEIIQKEM